MDDHSSKRLVTEHALAANPDPWAEASRRSRATGSLFGIAPGGACRAGTVASPAVGSYPTVSSLPRHAGAVSFLWRFPSGFPARALPGTVASWSPDFPRPDGRGHPAPLHIRGARHWPRKRQRETARRGQKQEPYQQTRVDRLRQAGSGIETPRAGRQGRHPRSRQRP